MSTKIVRKLSSPTPARTIESLWIGKKNIPASVRMAMPQVRPYQKRSVIAPVTKLDVKPVLKIGGCFDLYAGVPIPKKTGRIRTEEPMNYPWSEMKVGMSFFIPGARRFHCRLMNGTRCTSRYVQIDDVWGMMVWRLK